MMYRLMESSMLQVVVKCPFCGKEFSSLQRVEVYNAVAWLPEHEILRGIPCPRAGDEVSPLRQMELAMDFGEMRPQRD